MKSACDLLLGVLILTLTTACSGPDDNESDADVEHDGDVDHDADMEPDSDQGSPCDPNPCTEEGQTVCEADGQIAHCLCNPGWHQDEDGGCVPDERCEETTCNGHGQCELIDGAPACDCETGYIGAFCSECDLAAGFYPDGRGGCTTNPCDPNPCLEEGRSRCVHEDGEVSCECDAGLHEEDGRCVPDETCSEMTCNRHGECSELSDGDIVCGCDEGWIGERCTECDEATGYHEDGSGGCTTDPCTPNPCEQPNRSICLVLDEGEVQCDCDPGHHLEGDRCVVDQVCSPDSCGDHGDCEVVDGVTLCSCHSGFTGALCDGCDEAAGFHPDGSGGCTTDPCTPNPCVEPGQTVCLDDGDGSHSCHCDDGLHPDGTGGCTDDPCVPDPCVASGQACRDAGDGTAECFTPECDDHNPCTEDSAVGAECLFDPLPDGFGCSTTLCLSDQQCSSGECAGGTTVSCDDGDPCTADSCDDLTGCQHEVDDSLAPDDGVACTVDTCTDGLESHAPDDSFCGDGLYCTGVLRCLPEDPDADSEGCVATAVPTPPEPSSFCRSYDPCDETTHSFPLVARAPGTDCDDGIACTIADQCNADGRCQGTVTASCVPGGECLSTEPLPATIDIPTAQLGGTITQNGDPLPIESYNGSTVSFYLVSRDTNTRHELTELEFDGPCCVNYELQSDGTYTSRTIAGVYDLMYRRSYNSSSDIVWESNLTDNYVNGLRMLQQDVVVPSGYSRLDIDIPTTNITGTITQDGTSLPTESYNGSTVTFYLVSRDTNTRHELTELEFDGPCCVNYELQGDGTYTSRMLSGTYDLMYRRNYNSSSDMVWESNLTDNYVNGYRLLQEDVVISGESQVLDIDIPTTNITGTITQNGGPLPVESYNGSTVTFYLVSRDTNTRHELTELEFDGPCCVNYELQGDGTYTSRMLSGTYDLMYRRNYNSSSDIVWESNLTDNYVNGLRVLQRDVVISGESQVLDIDIPTTNITGTITQNGEPLPIESYSGSTVSFYLVSRDDGTRHELTEIEFDGPCCVNYELQGDGTYTSRMLSGTYDLMYRRNYNSSSDIVWESNLTDNYVNGYLLLQENVVISGESQVLDIDIPTTNITGTITQNGGPLPVESYSGSTVSFYLVSHNTNTRHELTELEFDGPCCVNYELQSDGTYTSRMLSGTYDLMYRRNYNSSSDIVWESNLIDNYVNGYRILQRDVVISGESQVLDIDIPVVLLDGAITQDGMPLPTESYNGSTVNFYMVPRDSGVRHEFTELTFDGPCCVDYELQGDGSYHSALPAGDYDLLYRRNYNSSSDVVWETNPRDNYVNGYRILRSCLAVD